MSDPSHTVGMEESEEVFRSNLKQFISSSVKSAVHDSLGSIALDIGRNVRQLVSSAQTLSAGGSRLKIFLISN